MQQAPMYVRTTYATGDPAKIGAALEALRSEAPGLLAENSGYRGYGLFADREIGKIIMGSWWESEQDRANSDKRLRERRAALLAPFADTVTFDNWEAAVYTQTPQVSAGAGMRLGRLEFDPSNGDAFVQTYRDVGLPKLEALPGFAGSALFIDRAAGRATVSLLFKDKAALAASRGPNSAVRGESLAKAKVTLRSIEEFEVVLVERKAP
ncbi:hypothetical protein QMK19_14990 [Streptomyces sp. H10-C2]|uniref:hypothetical protein n=1 Tax=unclassified Streptomyces TaxID=2593676 RepID=UPI0024BA2151|nr:MULTISPECIES: hypothetical protein [unclassified Streptomyces]MDJ0341360.1 hypothetical protein [Streptomyces sp. PH10-H1]MDJ0370955.1 hypothetical protein [Streptomyces sp. H10-C2]